MLFMQAQVFATHVAKSPTSNRTGELVRLFIKEADSTSPYWNNSVYLFQKETQAGTI